MLFAIWATSRLCVSRFLKKSLSSPGNNCVFPLQSPEGGSVHNARESRRNADLYASGLPESGMSTIRA